MSLPLSPPKTCSTRTRPALGRTAHTPTCDRAAGRLVRQSLLLDARGLLKRPSSPAPQPLSFSAASIVQPSGKRAVRPHSHFRPCCPHPGYRRGTCRSSCSDRVCSHDSAAPALRHSSGMGADESTLNMVLVTVMALAVLLRLHRASTRRWFWRRFAGLRPPSLPRVARPAFIRAFSSTGCCAVWVPSTIEASMIWPPIASHSPDPSGSHRTPYE